jgi:hypothetical protein
MNMFRKHQPSAQRAPPLVVFSMGMPSIPSSHQLSSSLQTRNTNDTATLSSLSSLASAPQESSPQIELVTPQSSKSAAVQINVLPEFTMEYESDDDDHDNDDNTFQDVEIGNGTTPTTTTAVVTGVQVNHGDTKQQQGQHVQGKPSTAVWFLESNPFMVFLSGTGFAITFVALVVVVIVIRLQ